MKRTSYVTNEQILAELEIYWKTGKVTDKLAEMIYLITKKIAGSRNFSRYSFRDDMVQEGAWHAINRGIPGFDKIKNNPFCYFSVIIQFKFIEYIKKEKRNLTIKEKVTEKLKGEILEEINKRK